MKTIKLNVNNPLISAVEVPDGDFLEQARKLIGCEWIGTVYPRGLKAPYLMIVDEEGLLKANLMNPIGSVLYGAHEHGNLIVGDAVIAKTVFDDYGECDLAWLTDEEAKEAFGSIRETLGKFGVEYPDKLI